MKISFFNCSGVHYKARVKYQNLEANVRNLIILGFYVKNVGVERPSEKEVSRDLFHAFVSAYHLIRGETNVRRKDFSSDRNVPVVVRV